MSESVLKAVQTIRNYLDKQTGENRIDLQTIIPALFDDHKSERDAADSALKEFIKPRKGQLISLPVENPLRATIIGGRLRHTRKRRGMTQWALAKLCKTFPASICSIEKGYTTGSTQLLERLAKNLSKPRSYFDIKKNA